jgi:hypothetical protein
VSQVRLILFALICCSPAILLADGLIVQGVVAGILAVALALIALNLRPGETEFFISIFRWAAVIALVPALWIIVQLLPLGVLVHPIWKSAEKALGHHIAGTISVDFGASVIALGQYLSMAAVAFVSAAIAVDRMRAGWVLFAIVIAGTLAALILLMNALFPVGIALSPLAQTQALDCTSLGTIASGAACVRTLEQFTRRQSSTPRSGPLLLWTLAACVGALVICGGTLLLSAAHQVLVATACGLLALACLMAIRRLAFRIWGATAALAVLAAGCAVLLLFNQPFDREKSLSLAFATSSTALSERLLADVPIAGTGAGTFRALAQIYREIDDPAAPPVAATTAASFGIELGKPMLWIIVALTCGAIIFLLRASLRRGRDSFYPAMAGGSLITLLLVAFVNAGLLGTATGLIAAAGLGLGVAQSRSRTLQP